MNSSSFILSARSADGWTVYFDLHGFTLAKENAYRYPRIGPAAIMARCVSDRHAVEVLVLDGNNQTVMVTSTNMSVA
jgi:hypothetical protein